MSYMTKMSNMSYIDSNIWLQCQKLYMLPRLPGSGLKCNDIRCDVVWWIFTDNNTTPTKLFYFVLLVGLWQ